MLEGVDDAGPAKLHDPWILAVVQMHMAMEVISGLILLEKFSEYFKPLVRALQVTQLIWRGVGNQDVYPFMQPEMWLESQKPKLHLPLGIIVRSGIWLKAHGSAQSHQPDPIMIDDSTIK